MIGVLGSSKTWNSETEVDLLFKYELINPWVNASHEDLRNNGCPDWKAELK